MRELPFQPQNGRLQECEISPAAPLKLEVSFPLCGKSVDGNLFLVLVPQGLELLLALVLGDLFTPFFLQVAHNNTTFVQLFNKTDYVII
jgi:hypothetical protein